MTNKFKVGDEVTYKHQPFRVYDVPNLYFVVVEDPRGKKFMMKADILRPVVAEPVETCCICKCKLPEGHKTVCKECCEGE